MDGVRPGLADRCWKSSTEIISLFTAPSWWLRHVPIHRARKNAFKKAFELKKKLRRLMMIRGKKPSARACP